MDVGLIVVMFVILLIRLLCQTVYDANRILVSARCETMIPV